MVLQVYRLDSFHRPQRVNLIHTHSLPPNYSIVTVSKLPLQCELGIFLMDEICMDKPWYSCYQAHPDLQKQQMTNKAGVIILSYVSMIRVLVDLFFFHL